MQASAVRGRCRARSSASLYPSHIPPVPPQDMSKPPPSGFQTSKASPELTTLSPTFSFHSPLSSPHSTVFISTTSVGIDLYEFEKCPFCPQMSSFPDFNETATIGRERLIQASNIVQHERCQPLLSLMHAISYFT